MILLFINFLIIVFGKADPIVENICGTMVPREGDADWGNQCFRLPKSFYATIYSDTSGTIYGTIKPYYSSFMIYDRENHEIRITGMDTETIGDGENSFVKLKETTSTNYYNCFWKTFKGGLYLSKAELANY
ncbi:MAG: hypothetical protein WBP41_20955, partial [Saprospiraceae bacterium]